jgi:hypothetical protein
VLLTSQYNTTILNSFLLKNKNNTRLINLQYGGSQSTLAGKVDGDRWSHQTPAEHCSLQARRRLSYQCRGTAGQGSQPRPSSCMCRPSRGCRRHPLPGRRRWSVAGQLRAERDQMSAVSLAAGRWVAVGRAAAGRRTGGGSNQPGGGRRRRRQLLGARIGANPAVKDAEPKGQSRCVPLRIRSTRCGIYWECQQRRPCLTFVPRFKWMDTCMEMGLENYRPVPPGSTTGTYGL